jgi:PAB-dependent poly(A)-specific ribonuclease subunit 2
VPGQGSSSSQIPAVVYYQRVDARQLLNFDALPQAANPSILTLDSTIARRRDPSRLAHTPLASDEIPRKGTLIAIDAEFVSLQQEEAEVHSNGTRRVIRPSRMTLARVSVLRGEGTKTGMPFIDDYIHTSDPVEDYLTEFSGILRELAFPASPTF